MSSVTMKNEQPILLIEISGSPRERGRQYGEAARTPIRKAIEFYREMFASTIGLGWADVRGRAIGWIETIEAYLPGIMDEIKGIGEGSGQPFEDILVLNMRGEMASGGPSLQQQDGCTSFALPPKYTGDGHTYCGQNWDWLAEVAETVMMLRIHQPPQPTIIMQVEAGQIGRQGVNSSGLALNANGLGGKAVPSLSSIPQSFIRRRILNSDNMNDALKAVFKARPFKSYNLLLTHRYGVAIDLETTPFGHQWIYPQAGPLVHGNHFQGKIPSQMAENYQPWGTDSLYRVPIVEDILRDAPEADSPGQMRALIMKALRDHFGKPYSVCAHVDEHKAPFNRYQTIASNIVDLTDGAYYVTLGPPCLQEYQRLPWNLYQSDIDG